MSDVVRLTDVGVQSKELAGFCGSGRLITSRNGRLHAEGQGIVGKRSDGEVER